MLKNSFLDTQKLLLKIIDDQEIEKAWRQSIQKIQEMLLGGGTIYCCGNGGSYCQALHLAEELTGRYKKERAPIAALALGEASHMTCVSNDYSFDEVFARQLEALGRSGDVLLCLSTSGNSKNLIQAVNVAREKSIYTLAFLGRDGGELKKIVDKSILIPHQESDKIQELHLLLIHQLVQKLESDL